MLNLPVTYREERVIEREGSEQTDRDSWGGGGGGVERKAEKDESKNIWASFNLAYPHPIFCLSKSAS